MDILTENKLFEESKIFEKLESQPEPIGYSGILPWIVQQQIAATNGIQYVDRIGKLKDYPQYELPVPKVKSGLMLDIGCGWGRWMVSGNRKGYIPIGIDIRLEFCEASLETLKANNVNGYVVVADLKELPFKDDVFNLVWSFSVIQHTHKERLLSCINEIYRILKPGGFTKLEFPNKKGFRNALGPVKQVSKVADDYNSWDVRYYTIEEYRDVFKKIFNSFKYEVHSFLGIGVLKEDLKYVSLKNKLLCAVSLCLTGAARIFTPLQKKADSIYIEALKNVKDQGNNNILELLEAHRIASDNNLNIVTILKCPITGGKLSVSESSDFLYNESKTFKYPIVKNIPIVIRSQAMGF